MSESVGSLLNQGLIMTALGMGLVFAALALLWGLMRLLGVLLGGDATKGAGAAQATASTPPEPEGDELTEERARVAALVAGALLANALPLMLEPPAGPAFEHGRVAPSWVVANRSHALQVWHPQRKPESVPRLTEPY